MNISIEDAIDLHRCVEYIEIVSDNFKSKQSCTFGLVTVSFTKMNDIKIISIFFDDHESLIAKEKLHEYFDE